MSYEDVHAALGSGDARRLAEVLRAAHDLDEASARAVLAYFAGRTAKGVAWSAGMDDSEATVLLGHLRARAGEV